MDMITDIDVFKIIIYILKDIPLGFLNYLNKEQEYIQSRF